MEASSELFCFGLKFSYGCPGSTCVRLRLNTSLPCKEMWHLTWSNRMHLFIYCYLNTPPPFWTVCLTIMQMPDRDSIIFKIPLVCVQSCTCISLDYNPAKGYWTLYRTWTSTSWSRNLDSIHFLETLHTIWQIFLHQRCWTTTNRSSPPSEYSQIARS